MSKNTRTYILLGTVLVIWGLIGLKIFNAITPEAPQETRIENIDFKPMAAIEKDTFHIVANYRDPFLGTLPVAKKTRPKVKSVKATAPKRAIAYTGSIANKDRKKSVFFVTIEGKQFLMKIGQTMDKVKLLNGSAQTIRVRYDGRTETITLQ
ncbi:hypothetical protein [uncultured Croceitalea sp.]|uniref:hypothetical protein n=1 Tax=uncultured Croceitalea sp. TaxID=1798908 RepID=UPI003305ED87